MSIALLSKTRRTVIALAFCAIAAQVGIAFGQGRSSRLPLVSNYAPDGVLEPWRISEVACVETGLVKRIDVKVGDRVKSGQKLAQLDTATIERQLAIAVAQAKSHGRLDSARAEVALNERKVAAFREARNNQYSSQTELERAEADLRIAEGRLESEIEEQQILELQVERMRQQLQQRTVVAPFDGIVVEVHKEIGEYVAPNAPELVRLVDVSRLRTSFFLKLDEVRSLPTDGRLPVLLSDGERVDAEIEHVSPVADSESGLIEVRVLVDNPSATILGSRCSMVLEDYE